MGVGNKKLKIIITESQYNRLLSEQETNAVTIDEFKLEHVFDNDDEKLFNRFLNKKKFDEITFDFPIYEIKTPNIDKLPDNMTFEGDLTLILPNLEKLPENLTVNGNLHIFAPKVTQLPETLFLSGILEIINTGIVLDKEQAKVIAETIGSVGIFSKNNLKITIDIDLIDSDGYLSVGRDYSEDIFEHIFGEDTHEWFNMDFEDFEVEYSTYYIDNENKQKIEEYIQKYIEVNNIADDELEDMDFAEKIDYLDLDDIKMALWSAYNDSNNHAHQNYLIKEVISAYKDYGHVEELSWDKIRLTVDLSDNIVDMDEYDFDNNLKSCGTDLECWFNEMKGNEIDEPRFSPDDRYSPSPDKEDFNLILSDRLSDVEDEMFS